MIFPRNHLVEVDEREIFKGSENTLTMTQTYTHRFQCQYRLGNYPFDTQVPQIYHTTYCKNFQTCSIDMTVGKLDRPLMRLLPKELIMEQDPDMTLFQLIQWDLNFRNTRNQTEGIWMKVVLKRKLMSEMMTTYLPSLLLLMITFATTFFKPFFFEAALTVNLTNMLVMTTIFISVMEKLPLTSYPKMIDYWLIFCQLVPFSEVILLQ